MTRVKYIGVHTDSLEGGRTIEPYEYFDLEAGSLDDVRLRADQLVVDAIDTSTAASSKPTPVALPAAPAKSSPATNADEDGTK